MTQGNINTNTAFCCKVKQPARSQSDFSPLYFLSLCSSCSSLLFRTLSLSLPQRPGGHPQPVPQQQHGVAGGVHGVLGHEERHSVRAVRPHRHLLAVLAAGQEVSHLQGPGPVQNQGASSVGSSTSNPTQPKGFLMRWPRLSADRGVRRVLRQKSSRVVPALRPHVRL